MSFTMLFVFQSALQIPFTFHRRLPKYAFYLSDKPNSLADPINKGLHKTRNNSAPFKLSRQLVCQDDPGSLGNKGNR